MYLLDNTVRPYAWGSRTAMAELFGREPSGEPEAELWIGAHPGAPSALRPPVDDAATLDALIDADPEGTLGFEAMERFGPRLPFLAKVLAAGSPLSLQVHPTAEQARAGFAAEDQAGLDRAAPDRNYRDEFHKPEMILALTPFDALCGFSRPEASAQRFRALNAVIQGTGTPLPDLLEWITAELESGRPEAERCSAVFRRLIRGDEEVVEAVRLAVSAVAPLGRPGGEGGEDDGDGHQRELATVGELGGLYPDDAGVLISLLLNRVCLQPGEAVHLPAGNLHAYLCGTGIEVMASSDNVLRGGLTQKHVDVPELLKTVDFRPIDPPLIQPRFTGMAQELYRPPFAEFQLQRLGLSSREAAEPAYDPAHTMSGADVPVLQNGPTVVLAVRGTILLDSPKGNLLLEQGSSAFIPAAEAPVIAKLSADSAQHAQGALAFAVTTNMDQEVDER